MELAIVLAALVVLAMRAQTPRADAAARVQYRELASGVHPSLQGLLDAWAAGGTHAVRVAPNGGLRTDSALQAGLAQLGLTAATDLASTPHGRGAGLDVWPVDFDPHRSFGEQPGQQELMRIFGEFAEVRGFVWGGRWAHEFTPGIRGDWPHVEVPLWGALPYPPPDYGDATA